MNSRPLRAAVLALALGFCAGAAAQSVDDRITPAPQSADPDDPCEQKSEPRGLHVLLENDVFAEKLSLGKSDRWYTNGIKFMVSLRPNCVPELFSDRFRKFVGWGLSQGLDGRKQEIQLGFTMGQLMFTPQDIRNPAPQPRDRYWGGWLYAGTILQRQPEHDPNSALETLELDYGFVGPLSMARQAQEVVHGAIDVDLPRGWPNQLRTEIGLQATYSRSERMNAAPRKDEIGVDFASHYGFGVGTLFNYVNAGVTARFGYGLDAAPLGTIESPSLGGFADRGNRGYWLMRLDAKRVFHNTFIDGSLFRRAPHDSLIERRPVIVQATVGAVLELEAFPVRRIAFLLHRRSAEFNVPSGIAPVQTFATVQLEVPF